MSTAVQPISETAAQLEERVAKAIEEEEAHQEETLAQCHRLIAAGDEPGFCGDVRRAIHGSGVSLEKIADAAGIEVFALCDFLEGTSELTSTQIAAIVQLLNLQLVRPIPASGKKSPSPPGFPA